MEPKKNARISIYVNLVAVSLLLCSFSSAAAQNPTQNLSLKIIQRAADVMDHLNDMIAHSKISNPKTGQTYEMRLVQKIYGNLDTKSIVSIEEPSSLKGMTFLFHNLQGQEPAQWIFVPKTLRVRQIATMDEATFLGMDIQFEDFQFIQLAQLDDAAFRILKPKAVNGTQCAVIEKTYGTKLVSERRYCISARKRSFR